MTDLTGNGSKDVIYADQGLDRVVVDYGAGNSTVLADQATGLLEPGAVKLADLNGDGIPDLIVANSGGNDVLIYPGLGNGQFGPAINGGNGYFVGTDPVGITVADLNGAACPTWWSPTRARTRCRSCSTSRRKGGAIAFSAGPRLNSGGCGPVSTVVGNFTGGAFPDLLVTNSGSNDVTLLPGVGQGFFNDQDPRTYSVGSDPVASFVGNFSGQTDLVTVNAGFRRRHGDLRIRGLECRVITISSGGVDPTTAFAFVADDGFEDLVVGNSGDGELALYEGGDDGLDLVSVDDEPNLPDPTALAFSALTGGVVEFYAATAGREEADLVSLSLSIELDPGRDGGVAVALLGATDGDGRRPGSPARLCVNSRRRGLSVLAISVLAATGGVARFVAAPGGDGADVDARGSGEESGAALPETEALGIVASLVAPGNSAGQGVFATARAGGSDLGPTDGADEPGATGQEVRAALAPWERFVLGLDEALEEQEREGAGGLMGPSEPGDRPAPSPREVMPPAAGGGSGLRSVPDRPPGTEWEDPAVSLPATPTGAIDAVNAGNQIPWQPLSDHDCAGRRDRRGDREANCRSVGRPPRRGPTPRSPARDGFRRPGARVRRRLPPGVPTGAPSGRDMAIRHRPRGGGSAGSPSPSCESPRGDRRATGRRPRHVGGRCHPVRSGPADAPPPAVVEGTHGTCAVPDRGRGRVDPVRCSRYGDRT